MFDALLKNKFCAKCKSAIKQTKTRIQIVKRKRNAMLKYLKNDVSDLLKDGLDSNAYGRVEGLWNEQNLSSCYDLVEKFCVHTSTHLQNMNKQSECPEECREAVSSLIFAAARFADLPELRELRAAFTEKYGNSTEIFANKEFVNKLRATPPTNDMKLQLMREIAAEYGIEWNSKALEQKLYKNILSVHALHSHGNDETEEESFAETTDDAAAADILLNKHAHQRGTDSPKKEGAGNFDNIKGGARAERINRKQQQKQENPNGLTASEREVEGVPASHERKELTGDEIDFPVKRENAAVEGKLQDEPQTDEKRPFFYKPFRPPYTKPRTSNVVSSLTATPTGTGNESAEHTEEPSHIDRENHLQKGEPNGGKVKPVPKSVRRRFLKPQAVPADEDEEGEKQRKVALYHDPTEEEEKKLDYLLAHYSKKKSSSDGSKLESAIDHSSQQAAAADNFRRIDNKGKDAPPPRTVSLPNESSPAETPRKELSKAASFQAENCHIHPRLPDYEDFVARLAAFRGKLE